MSTNDNRESNAEDHALGTGASGDLENPAEGLSAATAVTPVGSEPINGVGVAGDTPAPAAAPVSRTEGAK